MTAPVRSSEPAVVNVALGARGYDVMIGRGALAGLGERIAALRPGASAAIVTDTTVASHHLGAAEASALARTCAHRTLPFGTRLEVTFQGKSTIVRVNDRGPAAYTGRSLDLSRGAAADIGLTAAGSGVVAIRILN